MKKRKQLALSRGTIAKQNQVVSKNRFASPFSWDGKFCRTQKSVYRFSKSTKKCGSHTYKMASLRIESVGICIELGISFETSIRFSRELAVKKNYFCVMMYKYWMMSDLLFLFQLFCPVLFVSTFPPSTVFMFLILFWSVRQSEHSAIFWLLRQLKKRKRVGCEIALTKVFACQGILEVFVVQQLISCSRMEREPPLVSRGGGLDVFFYSAPCLSELLWTVIVSLSRRLVCCEVFIGKVKVNHGRSV